MGDTKSEPVPATPEEKAQGKALYMALSCTIGMADQMGMPPNVIMSAVIQAAVSAQLNLGAVEPEEMLIEGIKLTFEMRAKDVETEGNA